MGSRGYSVVELLVALAIAGIMVGIGVYNFRDLNQPAEDGAVEFAGFVRRVRAKGLATTYAYTLSPSTVSRVTTTYGISCTSTAQTADSRLVLDLPSGASFSSLTWSVCFSPRGISTTGATVNVRDATVNKVVEIAAGGGTKIQ